MNETPEIEKGHRDRPPNIWLGLIFIFGGIAVLLNQLEVLPFELNWWALFILIPAAGMLSGAYNRFRSNDNQFSMDMAFPALIGLFLAALAISLLFEIDWNIDWGLLWPLIIILIGLGMIFGRPRRE
jgi:drug/metabolite transporter (DMT)-like permease